MNNIFITVLLIEQEIFKLKINTEKCISVRVFFIQILVMMFIWIGFQSNIYPILRHRNLIFTDKKKIWKIQKKKFAQYINKIFNSTNLPLIAIISNYCRTMGQTLFNMNFSIGKRSTVSQLRLASKTYFRITSKYFWYILVCQSISAICHEMTYGWYWNELPNLWHRNIIKNKIQNDNIELFHTINNV